VTSFSYGQHWTASLSSGQEYFRFRWQIGVVGALVVDVVVVTGWLGGSSVDGVSEGGAWLGGFISDDVTLEGLG
jgi:hypothetical protein